MIKFKSLYIRVHGQEKVKLRLRGLRVTLPGTLDDLQDIEKNNLPEPWSTCILAV